MTRALVLVWTIAIVAVLAVGTFAWRAWTKPAPEVAVAVEVPPAPILKKIKKVSTPVPKGVQTYAPEAKAKLKLPASVIADTQAQVVAATQVKDTGRPQTVTSVLDVATGEVKTYVKQEPLPWIAFNQRGQVRLSAGYKLERITGVPQRVGRLSVEHDFVQAKALSMGVVASIDTDGSAFAGVGIAYRW